MIAYQVVAKAKTYQKPYDTKTQMLAKPINW